MQLQVMETTQVAPKIELIEYTRLPGLAASLLQHPVPLCVDIETTGLKPFREKIVLLQFGTRRKVYLLDHRPFYNASKEEKQNWSSAIRMLIASTPVIVGHNLKFDYGFLRYTHGIQANSMIDTQIQEQVIHSAGLSDHYGVRVNMKDTAARYGISVSKDGQVWSVGLDKPRNFLEDGSYCVEVPSRNRKGGMSHYWFNQEGIKVEPPLSTEVRVRRSVELWTRPFPDAFLMYGARDIIVPLEIAEKQQHELERKGLLSTAALENHIIEVFTDMEIAGVPVNSTRWRGIIDATKTHKTELEQELIRVLAAYTKSWKVKKYVAPYMTQWAVAQQELEQLQAHISASMQGFATPMALIKQNDSAVKVAERKVKSCLLAYERAVAKAEEPLNLGSSEQLKGTFEELGITLSSTSKQSLGEVLAAYETEDENATAAFFSDHEQVSLKLVPIIQAILDWKKESKLVSSFGDTILGSERTEQGTKGYRIPLVDTDGRLRCDFLQLGAGATGRVSCRNPNLQQIPQEDKKHPELSLRRCVEAPQGKCLVVCDLPNIELRILADFSKDPTMLDIFAADRDLHGETAVKMFNLMVPKGVGVKDFTDNYKIGNKSARDLAKPIGFGLCYGLGPRGLAVQLKLDLETAKQYRQAYMDVYPDAIRFLDNKSEEAVSTGKTATRLGRKRFYSCPDKPTPPINATYAERQAFYSFENPNPGYAHYKKVKSAIGREGRNHPIQGTCADIMKLAMLYVHKALPQGCRLVACIHDELVVEASIDQAEEVRTILMTEMRRACLYFLKVVKIPELEAVCAPFWSKKEVALI